MKYRVPMNFKTKPFSILFCSFLFIFLPFSIFSNEQPPTAKELYSIEQNLLDQDFSQQQFLDLWELYSSAGHIDALDGLIKSISAIDFSVADPFEQILQEKIENYNRRRNESKKFDSILDNIIEQFLWQENPQEAIRQLESIDHQYDRRARVLYIEIIASFESDHYRQALKKIGELREEFSTVELWLDLSFEENRSQKALVDQHLRRIYLSLILIFVAILLFCAASVLYFNVKKRPIPFSDQTITKWFLHFLKILIPLLIFWILFFFMSYWLMDGFYDSSKGIPNNGGEVPVFENSGIKAPGSFHSLNIALTGLLASLFSAFVLICILAIYQDSILRRILIFLSIFVLFSLFSFRHYFENFDKQAIRENSRFSFFLAEPELFVLREPQRYQYIESSRIEDPELMEWLIRRSGDLDSENSSSIDERDNRSE